MPSAVNDARLIYNIYVHVYINHYKLYKSIIKAHDIIRNSSSRVK